MNRYKILALIVIILSGLFFSKAHAQRSIVLDAIETGPYGRGSSISVLFKPRGVYPLDNTFELLLSDASGNFSQGTSIGTYTSHYTTFVNGVIPNNAAASTNYKVKIVAKSGATIHAEATSTYSIEIRTDAGTGGDFLINTTPNPNKWLMIKCNNVTNFNIENNQSKPITGICKNEFDTIPYFAADVPRNYSISGGQFQSSTISNLNNVHYRLLNKITEAGTGVISTQSYYLVNNKTVGPFSAVANKVCYFPGSPGEFKFKVDIDRNITSSSQSAYFNFPGYTYEANWSDNSANSNYTIQEIDTLAGLLSHHYTITSCNKQVTTNTTTYYNSLGPSLTVKNYNPPCSQTANSISPIQVFEKPEIDFSLPTKACTSNSITVINTSQLGTQGSQQTPGCVTPNITFRWFVDNAFHSNQSVISSITLTNLTPGNHTVELRAIFDDNEIPCPPDNITKTICIEPVPTPNFKLDGKDSVVGCTPQNVSVTNNLTPKGDCGGTAFQWQVSLESTPNIAILPNTGIYTVNPNLTADNPSFNFLVPGRYIVKLSAVNSCGTHESFKKVIMLGTTNVTLPPNKVYCLNGTTINFATNPDHKPTYSSEGAGESYLWTVTGSTNYNFAPGSSATDKYPIINFTSNDTYTISVKFTNNCDNKTVSQQISFASPVSASVGASDALTVCNDATSINLSGTASGGYDPTKILWTVLTGGNGNFTPANNLTTTYNIGNNDKNNSPIKLVLSVEPTNTACVAVKDTFLLTIRPANTFTNATKEICSGNNTSIALTSSQPSSTFAWTSTVTGTVTGNTASGTTTNINDVLVNNGSTDATVTYTITPSKDGCTGTAGTYTVTVKPKPSLAVTSDATANTICSGQQVNFTLTPSVPNSTITWTSSASGGSITGNTNNTTGTTNTTFNNTLSTTGTTDVTVTYTFTIKGPGTSACPGDNVTYAVTVKPGISAAVAGNNQDLCNQTSVTLAATAPTVGTGSWTQTAGNTVTITNANQANTTVTGLQPNEAYTFRWKVSGSGGNCPENTDDVIITNRPAITPANAGSNQIICDFTNTTNNTATLTGNLDGTRSFETGQWTLISPATGATIAAPNSASSSVTFTQPGTYTFRWTISNGGACTPSTSDVVIKVYAKPVGGTPNSPSTAVCKGNNGTITLTGHTGVIEKWQSSTDNGVNWTDITNTTATYNYTNIDTTTIYRVIIVSAGAADACTTTATSATITIGVSTSSIGGTTIKDTVVCGAINNGSIRLEGYTGMIQRWERAPSATGPWATVTPANTTLTLNFTNLANTTYFRAVVKSGDCPESISSVSSVTVNAGTSPASAGPDVKLCAATTYTMQGTTPAIGTGSWTQITGPSATITNPGSATTTITGLQPDNIYQFKFTVAGMASCGNSEDTVTITNRPAITVANAGNNDKICDFSSSNNSITITGNADASRTYETGQWTLVSPTTGATISNPASASTAVTFTQPGVYTFRWTISNEGACTPSTDEVVINVYAAPDGGNTSTANATVCKGSNGSVTVASHVGTIVKWQSSIDNGTHWTDITNTSATYNYTNIDTTTIFRVLVNSAGAAEGCTSSDYSSETTVTVTLPSLGGVTIKDTAVCGTTNSGTITLENHRGNIIRWEYSTNGGANWQTVTPGNTTTTFNFLNLPQTTQYRAVVQNGICNEVTSTVSTVTVQAGTSNADAGPDVKLCAATSYTMQGGTPSVGTGTWTQISGPSVTIVTPTNPTTQFTGLTPGTDYEFRFTVQGFANCPSTQDDIKIENRPPLTQATAGIDTTICSFNTTTNNQLTLYANTAGHSFEQGTWSIINQPSGASGSFANINTNNTVFNFDKSGTYTLQWAIGNDAQSCTSTKDTIDIKVVDKVVAGTISANNVNVCYGNSVTLTNNGLVGITQKWQFKRPYTETNWTDTAVTAATIVFNNVTDTFIVRSIVQTIDPVKCTETIITNEVTINVAAPTVPGTTAADQTVCQGSNTGTITLTGNTGDIVRWESSTNNGGTWSPVANTTNSLTFNNLMLTTWYRAAVKNGTCNEAFSTHTVITVKNPVTTPNAGTDQQLCNANTATLAANNPSSDETGLWTQVSGTSVTIVSPATAATNITGLVPGTYSFEWTINNGICPAKADVIEIIVYPSVVNDIDNTPLTVCATQSVTVNGQVPTGGNGTYTYVWQESTDNISWSNMVPAQTGQNLTFIPTGSVYVRRVVTATPCISNSTSTQITVQPAITNNTLSGDQNVCINTSAATIVGSTPQGGNGVFIYQWQESTDNITFTDIATATNKDYSPGVMTVTMYYRRIVTTSLCAGAQGNTSDAVTIKVNPDARAEYTFTHDKDCSPFNINSSVVSPVLYPLQNGSYQWYANGILIGTGNTFPGYILPNPGDSVDIKMVAVSLFGCKNDSVEHRFYTIPKPDTKFTASDTVGCGPLTVTFTNTTPNIQWFDYEWDFGNGQTSNLAQPAPVVFQPNPTYMDTIYNVKLSAITPCETVIYTLPVRVKSKAKSIFTPDRTTGCSPFNVNFTNISKGIGVTYLWDFGDGTVIPAATTAPQSHTFHSGIQDTFDVKLIAINECGNDTSIYKIVVSPNTINLDFAVNGNEKQGCNPHTVKFINASSGAATFQWNFGDGNMLNTTKNIDTIYHTYLQPGNFTVQIMASNGCSDTTATELIQVYNSPVADFSFAPLSVCVGESIQFTNLTDTLTSLVWQFGNGNTSTQTNPTQSYTAPGVYPVKLTAFRQYPSGLSCSDTIQYPVTVISTRGGFFTVDDSVSNCVPFTVTFTNRSTPSTQTIWFLENGVTDTGDVITHTFTEVGTYRVKMRALHPTGCFYEYEKDIVVRGPAGIFTYDHGIICNPSSVRFSVNATGTGTFVYHFGDGKSITTTQNTVYHTYLLPGNYIPRVELISDILPNCSIIKQGLDTIKVDYIEAGYTYSLAKSCGSTEVQFTDTSRHYKNIASWRWDFGDGTFSNAQNPKHTYLTSNTWTIQLIVTSETGCSDTMTQQVFIKVNAIPFANINTLANACTNTQVLYIANVVSQDSISLYNWTFSNGANINGQTVTNIYNTPGNYNIRLVVNTIEGCADTVTQSVIVNPTTPIVAANDRTICRGQQTQLGVTGTGVTYSWAPLDNTLSCTTCPSPIAKPLTSTMYFVTGTNSFGCTYTDSIYVRVAQPIDVTITGRDTLCIGESTQLTASGATSYIWSPSAGLSATNIATPIATPNLTTRYRVIGFDAHNCFQDTAYITVAVGKIPTINLGPDKTLSTGTLVPLSSTVTNGPIAKWEWSPSNDLSCNDCPRPIATVKKSVCYNVIATTQYHCEAKDTMCITPFCENSQVFIPNGFTPDGDGINDVLRVRGIGIKTVKSFVIFNRWGQVVFERSNFSPNDMSNGWDGRINGKLATPDVFVYTCEVICENDVTYTYKGNTAILK